MLEWLKTLYCLIFPCDPCLVRVMREVVGLAYGDPKFAEITEPYWTRGKGTTCAVTIEWALKRCGWRGPLNRGPNWVSGKHLSKAIRWARAHGKIIDAPPLDALRSGDVLYLEGDTPRDWHVGVLETSNYPTSLVTLDGGQTDLRGEQAIERVSRPINAHGQVGPKYRRVKFVLRP